MKHDFKVMSSIKCDFPGCTRNIKQNLVDRKMRAPSRCFKHWKKPVGNPNRKSIKLIHGQDDRAKVKVYS